MLSIKDFILQDEIKLPKLLLQWLIIIGFIIIFLIGMNCFLKFNHYYKCNGIVMDDYLNIYVPINDMSTIVNGDYIYIDNDKYKYQVVEIGDNIIENNTIYYQKALIDVDLKNKNFINNQNIEVQFILGQETIFQYFINFIKGE